MEIVTISLTFDNDIPHPPRMGDINIKERVLTAMDTLARIQINLNANNATITFEGNQDDRIFFVKKITKEFNENYLILTIQ